MAADKSKVTNAEEIAAEARANERGGRHGRGRPSATRRDLVNRPSAFPDEDMIGKEKPYEDGRPSLKRSALYDISKHSPFDQMGARDAYQSNAENMDTQNAGKYRMPVEDRLPRTKTLYGPGSPTDIMGTSEQESTGLKKGGKVKAKAKAAAPKKFSRGGGIEVRGKTKGRFV